MATNAVYKIYSGDSSTGWVEYHFKTNAAQVDQTTGTGWRKWMSSSVTVNGVAFAENGSGASATINASNINWYGGTKPSTNYLGSAANIQAALVALDTAAKNAYDHVPSNCLTYGTNGNFGTQNPDLAAIEAISGTSGLLKKTAANTWELDPNTYLTSSTGVTSVAGHTGAVSVATLKSDLGLGDAAYKAVATSVTQNGTGLVTAGAVWSAIDALPEAMVFKGTVGDSATVSWANLAAAATSNEGWTYKVVTTHTADTKCPACKVGDTITSNGSAWVVIPSGDDVEDTWRIIQVNGTQLKGSGTSTGLINFVNGGNITVTGSGNNITLGVASGYSIPSTTQQNAWTAKYDKPSGGIPGSDLATAYLPLAGGTMTGAIKLGSANGQQQAKLASSELYLLDPTNFSANAYIKANHNATDGHTASALYLAYNDGTTTNGTWYEIGVITNIVGSNTYTLTLPTKTGTIALKEDHPIVTVGSTQPSSAKAGDIWIATA